jgi:translation initiation factor 5
MKNRRLLEATIELRSTASCDRASQNDETAHPIIKIPLAVVAGAGKVSKMSSHKHGWVNIEGTEVPVKDAFYRYQMPPLVAHMERTWTVLPTFPQISKALHRPEEEILKYFGITLCTQVIFLQGRASIKGDFGEKALRKTLKQYIQEFVLCGACLKPESAYRIRSKGHLVQKCFACGHRTPLDMDHKLSTYIVKTQYKPTKEQQSGSSRSEPPKAPPVDPLANHVTPVVVRTKKNKSKLKKKDSAKKNADKTGTDDGMAVTTMSDESALWEAVQTA